MFLALLHSKLIVEQAHDLQLIFKLNYGNALHIIKIQLMETGHSPWFTLNNL